MNIFKKIETYFENKLPFVAYRKPNENLIKGVFQQNDTLFFLENYTKTGFVFAPFDDRKKSVIIPLEHAEILEESIKINAAFYEKRVVENSHFLKEQHINLVKKGIEEIYNKNLQKVILSRKETVECKNFNLIKSFKKLLEAYSTAMVYVWYHPKVGLWLGATPEILLKTTENTFETVALAGTQIYNGKVDVFWEQKEVDEQQFVTDYLVKGLSKVCKKIKKSTTETIKTGNLLHLKTTISGNFNSNIFTLKSLLKIVHPTPAVCGLPTKKSKQFILQNENYDRTFYTGFLGELNFKVKNKKDILKKSELFVNLRCMEIHSDSVSIFVGGGITKESNPEKEWEETVAKSRIMKQGLE